MRSIATKLVFARVWSAAVIALMLFGGCGDDGGPADTGVVHLNDASTADAFEGPDALSESCSPSSQQGCTLGDRCTYRWQSVDPIEFGPAGCVSDGARSAGQSCQVDVNTGYDNCRAGFLCWQPGQGSPVCTEICQAPPDSCSTGTCSALVETGPSVWDGVCVN